MEIFYIIAILVVFARLGGILFKRIGQPEMVGELVAGLILGAIVHHYTETFPVLSSLSENQVFDSIVDLGIFFLMLLGGVEISTKSFKQASKGAIGIAIAGLVIPLVIGFGVGSFWLPDSDQKFIQSFFIGTALSITAVPIAIRVLMELNQLNKRLGRTLVAAAVIDDVLGLFLLALIIALIQDGAMPNYSEFLILGLQIIVFFALTVVLGRYVFPKVTALLKKTKLKEWEFSFLIATALVYALVAEWLELHFIVGAFMAGLFFSSQTPDKSTYESVKEQVSGLTHGLLGPVFFMSIGMHAQFSALGEVPLFVAVLVIAAIAGKLIGPALVARFMENFSARQSWAIGFGMSGRGAVELVVADIALRAGLFESSSTSPSPILENMFSAIVFMAIFTTVLAPIAMKKLLKNSENEQTA